MKDERLKKKYLNVKDVAYVFDIHTQTIYTWVRKNRIPHYKVGGVIRFNPDQVIKWAKKRRVKGW